ncbi:MAG: Uma2 family endonuclease, partial [Kamptonema sp. SIO4C4]|nr:Uma2 family endonuclease [Kamptonema sp. SIO4C4]
FQNASKMHGCTLLDLTVYPPPDLAIESDVTSPTTLAAYTILGVPEVWIYRHGELKLYRLREENYIEVLNSPTFPNIPLTEKVPHWVQLAIEQGTSQMLRQLKQELSE